jgi:hypothetical protein
VDKLPHDALFRQLMRATPISSIRLVAVGWSLCEKVMLILVNRTMFYPARCFTTADNWPPQAINAK